MEACEFFEYGKASLIASDYSTRTAAIDICMPYCLFQTVTPQLLGAGYIDNFRIRDPLAVWIPKLSKDRFGYLAQSLPNIDEKINVALREEASKTAKLFIHLQGHLIDPSDAIPLLPLGVYTVSTFRVKIDNILSLLNGINSIKVAGVPEFQWALATVLKQVLLDFERVSPKLSLLST